MAEESLHKKSKLINRSHESHLEEIDLKEIFFTIRDGFWFIVLINIIAISFALLYYISVSSQYESTALIQVENKKGLSESLNFLDKVGINEGSGPAMSAQIESALITSRFILQPTIEKLKLDIYASPNYFPIFGHFMAKRYGDKNNVSKPFLGLSRFAWGGESITVSLFEVPKLALDETFYLVAEKNNEYKLYTSDRDFILKGKVGELVQSGPGTPGNLKIFVKSLNSRAGAEFKIRKIPIYQLLDKLIKDLNIVDYGQKADAARRSDTGILNLSLKGTNPSILQIILNTVIYYDVQKNIEKKSEEVKKTLQFLNNQLPVLKENLYKAETNLNNYLGKRGLVGMNLEGKILLDKMVKVEESMGMMDLKKAELSQSFTDKHPVMISLEHQKSQLRKELEVLEDKVKTLPASEQVAVNLERDVKVQDQLYLLMLSKIQELQVASAGIISDVRVLGWATKPLELPSKKLLIFVGSLLFGTVLAIMMIFMRKVFIAGVEDPDYVEEHLNIPVYAVVPYSKKQGKLFKKMRLKALGAVDFLLGHVDPKDIAIEGLRNLRTTVHFMLIEAKNNIISILGANRGVGKSFVSSNFSYLLADSGKKVLLIDADMRLGRIAEYFNKKRPLGLSEILENKISFDEAKRVVVEGKFDLLTSGEYPRNPAELLFSDRFKTLLEEVSKKYDVVLIDTPPILAVTDALIITKYSQTNLLVVGEKRDDLNQLTHAVNRFKKNNININGLIFNCSTEKSKGYKYNYYYYEYKD